MMRSMVTSSLLPLLLPVSTAGRGSGVLAAGVGTAVVGWTVVTAAGRGGGGRGGRRATRRHGGILRVRRGRTQRALQWFQVQIILKCVCVKMLPNE